jgi:hypothetical protein
MSRIPRTLRAHGTADSRDQGGERGSRPWERFYPSDEAWLRNVGGKTGEDANARGLDVKAIVPILPVLIFFPFSIISGCSLHR